MAGFDTARSTPLTGAAETLFPAKPLLDALTQTMMDGARRRVSLGASGERSLDFTVCRAADGELAIGLPAAAVDGEPVRRLARQLAAESSTETMLEILCRAGAEECAGNGAAVLKAVSNEGELVVAIGPLTVARGRRFGLPGSLAREVIRKRDVVAVDDFGSTSRPLTKVAPELRVGPMLLAPLVAHDVILGV